MTSLEVRSRRLVALGASVGLVLAAWGLLGSGDDAVVLPPEAVASVNGELVSRAAYRQALAETEKTEGPLDLAGQRRVLEQLIDEELFVQRAVELGFLRYDRRIRAQLVAGVAQSVAAEMALAPPSPEQLEAFHRAHRDRFPQELSLVEPQVREALIQQVGRRALRLYLERLREAAQIRLAERPS